MTHDDLTSLLRAEDWPAGTRNDSHDAADLLDQYRKALEFIRSNIE
jgi:hypothetical protein